MNGKDNSINKKLYKSNKEENIIILLNQKNNYNLIKRMESKENSTDNNSRINIDRINIFIENHKNIFLFLLKAFLLFFLFILFFLIRAKNYLK